MTPEAGKITTITRQIRDVYMYKNKPQCSALGNEAVNEKTKTKTQASVGLGLYMHLILHSMHFLLQSCIPLHNYIRFMPALQQSRILLMLTLLVLFGLIITLYQQESKKKKFAAFLSTL